MGSYEGIQERRTTASTASVLTQAQREGNMAGLGTITDPLNGALFPGGVIPADRLNPASLKIINQYMVLPNIPGLLTNNYAGVSASSINQNQYMARIDHQFSGKDQVFGHYIYHGGLYPSIAINPFFGTEHHLTNHSAAFQYLHTFDPTKLNEVRFGFMRANKERSPRRGTAFTAEKDLGITGLKVGGPNGRPLQEFENGFPQVNIAGYTGMGDSTGGEALDINRTYQFVDTLSLIRGKHSFKAGADIRLMTGEANTTNVPFGQLNFTRDISGSPVSAFMLGYPKTSQTPEGVLLSGIHQWRHAFYFQDDWRVTPRLTLNLGIRWDLNLLPKDSNGTSRTLRFDLDPAGPVLWPAPGEKADLYIKEHDHIAPRVGFAYRLRDTWVVRGGYGIFTMSQHFDQVNILQINPPNASILLTNANTNPLATIQNPFPASLLPSPLIYNLVSTEKDRKHPDGYYQNWNLNVGHEFSSNDSIELGYVGARERISTPAISTSIARCRTRGQRRSSRAVPIRRSGEFGCGGRTATVTITRSSRATNTGFPRVCMPPLPTRGLT